MVRLACVAYPAHHQQYARNKMYSTGLECIDSIVCLRFLVIEHVRCAIVPY